MVPFERTALIGGGGGRAAIGKNNKESVLADQQSNFQCYGTAQSNDVILRKDCCCLMNSPNKIYPMINLHEKKCKNKGTSSSAAVAADANGGRNSSDDSPPVEPEEEALDYMVTIPETDGESAFSFRKLWAFTGPGFLMSIAYLDPGNIESDLQSGTVARYRLLWVLLLAHCVGFFLQRLSARLGVVAGRSMAELAFEYYPRVPRLCLWAMVEIAIICSDMQEVIGTAIAFALLSNGRIPLFAGVLITMVDTFTFLLIDRYGFRKLEFIFAILISTMAITFGFEFVVVKPDGWDLLAGTLLPYCPGCGRQEFLQAISVVGAVIMPHNLYLHSALVKSRRIDRVRRQAVVEANFYYFIECAIALCCSFFINLFVVAVFAHGLFGKTNADIFKTCENQPLVPDRQLFPNDTDLVEADIYKGGIFLGCQFGMFALYVWGVGIMAAGQSSTMTGTYAGQFVMEGFLQIKWPRWRRVLFTRSIAIVPTFFVALRAQGVQNLTGMNDLLNCVQMVQLPFALIPIITFTANRRVMFDFSSTTGAQVFAFFTSLLVILINLYFSFDYILSSLDFAWYAWALLFGPGTLYMAFVVYLLFICLQSMGIVKGSQCDQLYKRVPWLARNDDQLTVTAPWTYTAAIDGHGTTVPAPLGYDNSAYDLQSTTNADSRDAIHQRFNTPSAADDSITAPMNVL
ncbi:hypothetical protein niasHT_031616 [Heterodera trifolii]|uniref:Malvolio n=1 Tax=Heterodera trifolii TaxID=157864 RepID=A0ABD2J436_9BILA